MAYEETILAVGLAAGISAVGSIITYIRKSDIRQTITEGKSDNIGYILDNLSKEQEALKGQFREMEREHNKLQTTNTLIQHILQEIKDDQKEMKDILKDLQKQEKV